LVYRLAKRGDIYKFDQLKLDREEFECINMTNGIVNIAWKYKHFYMIDRMNSVYTIPTEQRVKMFVDLLREETTIWKIQEWCNVLNLPCIDNVMLNLFMTAVLYERRKRGRWSVYEWFIDTFERKVGKSNLVNFPSLYCASKHLMDIREKEKEYARTRDAVIVAKTKFERELKNMKELEKQIKHMRNITPTFN
jgi:hypothetical protein